jgi:hypothetical protein
MNNLTELYKEIKSFADNHGMVNQFIMVASEDDLQQYDFEYRTLVMIPSSSNLSRDLNSPVYTLSFTLVVIDKTILDDNIASIQSIEENIFVIGQLQDKLLQLDKEVVFNEIELISSALEDYNVTTAFCDFDVVLPRSPYIKDINE